MLDKYFKFQKLVEAQKERKQKLDQVLQEVLGFLPKYEVEFLNQDKLNYKNLDQEIVFLIKVKIKDKSSVKFVVLKNQEKISEGFQKFFPKDIFKII